MSCQFPRLSISFPVLLVCLCFCLVPSACGDKKSPAPETSIEEENAWRAERDKAMRSPQSWLTIAGLFWLDDGDNTFGSGPDNHILLPAGSAPDFAGTLSLQDGRTILTIAPGEEGLQINGETLTGKTLADDSSPRPDVFGINNLRMWIIRRGDRFALRLRDLEAPALRNYSGLKYYPVAQEFHVNAEFVPHESPKEIQVPTVVGTTTVRNSPGFIRFELDGLPFSLLAFDGDTPETLFFVFTDLTAGKDTYEASRFLTAKKTHRGELVDLNFNRAHNPPCAYTPFATCPLPPPENHLDISIEAGEKKYSEAKHQP